MLNNATNLLVATGVLWIAAWLPDFASAQPPRTRPDAGTDPRADNQERVPESEWPRVRQPGERRETGERSVTNEPAPEVCIAPRIAPRRSGWFLGVYTERAPRGIRLSRIAPGSPAYRFGLEPGDYLLDVGGYVVGEYRGRYYPLEMAIDYGVEPSGWAELLVWNKRSYAEETIWVRFQRR